ncbi:MAG: phage endopeptidase [Glaciihabitans sp.]|nr:phage endopeptidase [Glaciihabitans sp.]
MGAIDNLSSSNQEIRALFHRLERLERAAPVGFSTVSRGALHITSPEGLIVDGSELVNGTLTIVGVLEADGTVALTGVLTNTGTTNLNGPTAIAGTLSVSGATSLAAALTIGTGGKIVVNGMTIGKLASGIGGISWGTSFPSLYSDGSQVAIGASSSQYVSVGTGGPAMVNGTRNFAIDATSHFMSIPQSSTSAANVYVNSTTGRLYMSTSARRFKIAPKVMKLAPSLLDVPMKDWIDRGARKRGEPEVRVPGIIAEEIAAAGGEQFVSRDAKNQIEGVAYDRLALARTQILADQLAAALKRIDELEKKLA